MKTLILITLCLLFCGPAIACDEYYRNDARRQYQRDQDRYHRNLRRQEEKNYRQEMLKIQKDMLWIEEQRDLAN